MAILRRSSRLVIGIWVFIRTVGLVQAKSAALKDRAGKEEARRIGGPPLMLKCGVRLRGLLNARRGGALGAFLGLVAHLGALGQGLEALAQDRAVMDEDGLGAVVGRNEPVALVVAKPLDCSSRHELPPLMCCERGGFGKATTRALDTTLPDIDPT